MAVADRRDRSVGLNLSAGAASVTVALILVALKLWALGSTSSLSVAASLADSALDLMMSLAGFMALIYAARPADEDHAFGHTSVEDLAALGQSVFILISGGVIGWAAVTRLLSDAPEPLTNQSHGIIAMALAVPITVGLVLWQRHVARVTGSRVVRADSLHYMSDLLPNLGAIAALAMSAWFGTGQVDSVVALAAAAMLVIGSLRIGKGAWDALMDRRADPVGHRRDRRIARDLSGRARVSRPQDADGRQPGLREHPYRTGRRPVPARRARHRGGPSPGDPERLSAGGCDRAQGCGEGGVTGGLGPKGRSGFQP